MHGASANVHGETGCTCKINLGEVVPRMMMCVSHWLKMENGNGGAGTWVCHNLSEVDHNSMASDPMYVR